MIPSAWLNGLIGFLVRGNGIGDGNTDVHANQVVLSDGVTGAYDEAERTVTVTSQGVGSTGPTGAGYYATSSTSTLIATGEKTFTTQAGLAYAAGDYVRIASAANSANYMEGQITGYVSTTLVVAVSSIGGSGTLADWRISLSGALGATGPGYRATSATTFTPEGYAGTVTVVTQAGLAYAAGDYIRVTSRSIPGSWSEGLVTAYSGTLLSWTDSIAGAGSYETDDWNIALRGDMGPTGDTGPSGPGVAATSATSRTIASGGTLTFETQSGLAYFPGMRLKFVSRSNTANWMQGYILTYSGTALTIHPDSIGGSGAHADWDIGIAGDVGATGATGPTGVSTFGPFGYTAGASGSTAPGWASTNTGADLYYNDALVEVQMPRAGTITGWSVHHGIAVSMDIEYDIEINGTPLELTMPVSATEKDASQTGLAIAFARGDLITFPVAPGSACYAKIYLEVTWDDA